MKPSDALTPDLREQLVTATGAALRNNEVFETKDAANRVWFIAPDTVDNHTVVLIRVSRGSDSAVQPLSTATLNPDVADAAIVSLDGALT